MNVIDGGSRWFIFVFSGAREGSQLTKPGRESLQVSDRIIDEMEKNQYLTLIVRAIDRSISSESPRIAKTTASTAAPKAYYSDADQSYPYYTIYDDDVSIYKDDGESKY